MLALSVKPPWSWAFFYAGKDIENRNWRPRITLPRRVLIHASKSVTRDEYEEDRAAIYRINREALAPAYEAREAGCILGTVNVMECVTESASPWFTGDYGFVVRNPVLLIEPIEVSRGALYFWPVSSSVEQEVRRQLVLIKKRIDERASAGI